MIASVEEMIEQYVASWNEQGLDAFKAAFARCWAEDATYTDPNFALIEGLGGIAGLAQASLEKIPTRNIKFKVIQAFPACPENWWAVDMASFSGQTPAF